MKQALFLEHHIHLLINITSVHFHWIVFVSCIEQMIANGYRIVVNSLIYWKMFYFFFFFFYLNSSHLLYCSAFSHYFIMLFYMECWASLAKNITDKSHIVKIVYRNLCRISAYFYLDFSSSSQQFEVFWDFNTFDSSVRFK